jgi:hypothetical protein
MAVAGAEKNAFTAHLHSMFTVRTGPDTTIAAELVEVLDRPAVQHHEQFSLIFRTPSTTATVQRTYDVAHPELGSLPLFLVPIRHEADGIYFEAAFSCISTPQTPGS